ncbi:MAG: sigma-54 dependent transcriptional regulator [Myxococcales bacterium]|nr:sigma-54 dependent transcriptional regulator [Myxococcales bacterium]
MSSGSAVASWGDVSADDEELPTHVQRGAVLLVDDEPLLLRAVERILRPEGHRIVTAGDWESARQKLEDPDLDVVLVDLFLGDRSGLDLLDALRRDRPEIEVIVMTGHASIESAVGCMRRGAFDYLAKPFDDVFRVRAAVRQAIDRRRLVDRNRELELELADRSEDPELVGRSAPLRALQRKVASLRHNESNVLIQGESGTGKELVARAIHAASPRRAGPFVAVDCGALPESIIESELFGHERGAFTGALGSPGLFRMAEGGTLFLDEIGEIPASVQAKLLRVLQQREVRPIGSGSPIPVDIRIVAASNRDLRSMVDDADFRMDLFYRLHVVRVDVPPLRERLEDVTVLARHFLAKHRHPDSRIEGLDLAAIERLEGYSWPGNVRELENVIESAAALAPGPQLRATDLGLGRAVGGVEPPPPAAVPLSLESYERCALERALRECDGDASIAARRLGIGRSTFYRKLARHGLRPNRPAAPAGRPEAIG